MKNVRVSPSQVKTWRDCKRKWAFRYVEGIKEPTTAKQQFGTDVHKILEDWITKGAAPPSSPEGEVAKQVIRSGWLPAPSPKLRSEEHLELDMGNGITLHGFADLIEPPTLTDPPIVDDFKTTSDLKWAMQQEELAQCPQALTYATWAMKQFRSDLAIARWLYASASNPRNGPRKPNGSRMVQHTFRRGDPAYVDALRLLAEEVNEIAHARRTWESASEAEPSPKACGKFGGCPHAERCEIDGGDLLVGLLIQDDREHGRVPSPLLQQTNETDNNEDPGSNQIQTKKETEMSLTDAINAKNTEAAKPANGGGGGDLLSRLKAMSSSEGVNPPTTPTPPTPPATPAEPDQPTELEAMKLPELKAIAKERGIPGASMMKKAVLIAAIRGDTEPPAEVVPAPDAKHYTANPTHDLAIEVPIKTSGLMVLVDCRLGKAPQGGTVVELADFVRPLVEKVEKENSVSHFALIDFAKGGPMLASQVAEWLKLEAPTATVHVDSFSHIGKACLDVLTQHATILIRGVW